MSDVKRGMERVTITLPPELLERIDHDRYGSGGKRSSFIVRILKAYYQRRSREELSEVRTALMEILRTPEGRALFHEFVGAGEGGLPAREDLMVQEEEVQDIPGPLKSAGEERAPLVHKRRMRGDSILITEEMKGLMRAFQDNPDKPVRKVIRRELGIDTSDIPRWISGEKPSMRKITWKKLRPLLLQYSGEAEGQ